MAGHPIVMYIHVGGQQPCKCSIVALINTIPGYLCIYLFYAVNVQYL